MPSVAAALTVGIVLLLAVTVTSGWLVYQNYQSRNAEKDRQAFLQVARQGALNLTTIDWQQADADIQRILAGATGPFHDDFAQRAQPFVEVVKQAQSKSEGTITEAALESESGTEAQALVAVKVKTATAQAPEQQLRSWRMRLTVQEKDNEIKVSNVEFVP
ncbi:mammalian cell entry protein [Mycobacterium sp. GA-2829]|nr:mammalian cell entry protein [Mycobacterium sp. GA-2829]